MITQETQKFTPYDYSVHPAGIINRDRTAIIVPRPISDLASVSAEFTFGSYPNPN